MGATVHPHPLVVVATALSVTKRKLPVAEKMKQTTGPMMISTPCSNVSPAGPLFARPSLLASSIRVSYSFLCGHTRLTGGEAISDIYISPSSQIWTNFHSPLVCWIM